MDLDEGKFTHLNALLDQTTIYSKFLSEQMEGLDEEEGRPAKKKAKTEGKSGRVTAPHRVGHHLCRLALLSTCSTRIHSTQLACDPVTPPRLEAFD